MKKFNIIYMHSHDTGRYVQPYGHAIATPNIQKLAEEGVLFRQAFTVNPTCSPSRAALLTGESPHNNGMLGLAHRGFSLYDYRRHIVHTLKSHGYHSALSGIQHIAHGEDAWKTIGYDEYLGGSAKAEEQAAVFISKKHDKPFFLSVGFFETHREFPEKHPEDSARYCLPPSPLPDTPENREDMARYKQSARDLDRKMGVVIDALKANNLSDNTLLVVTTDHGIAFPRMKCNLEDSGTGVMLIMRGPGGFSGGKVSDAMVTHLDIFPTVCDMLGVEKPGWLQGSSLVPLVKGGAEEIHKEIFAEVNYHAAFEPIRSVRTKNWKYIRRYDKRSAPVLPNCDDGFCKRTWMENGWIQIAPVEEALYNLIMDPNEKDNLISKPECPHVIEDMKARLKKWMTKTGDPLLEGDVVPPATALLNSRDAINPDKNTLPPGQR